MVLRKFFCIGAAFWLLGLQVALAGESNKPLLSLPTLAVHVIEVIGQDIPARIEVVGTVQAAEQAVIAAKVTGTITELPVLPGSRLEKGDLLVQISAEEISARMLQAQAQLAQARRNLDREKKLLARQATTSETVKSMQDMFAVAEAGYREAQTMLSYTTIIAPFAGVVTSKSAHAGDLAFPGIPLLAMENDQNLQVVSAIPESLAVNVTIGERLQVSVPAASFSGSGVVAEIAPTVDPLSRTTPIKINIEQSMNLRTGQFARLTLNGPSSTAIMVPQTAVVAFGQMDKVFAMHDKSARLRLVRTGRISNGQVEILAGLNPGDQIIIDNNLHLVDGQPVTVAP